MKNNCLLFLLLVGFNSLASAQKISGTVKGSLQDSTSAMPLEDATVSVMSLPDSTLISFTLSRSNGAFEIKNLATGEYQVVASFTGLKTFKKTFAISAAHVEEDLGTI